MLALIKAPKACHVASETPLPKSASKPELYETDELPGDAFKESRGLL